MAQSKRIFDWGERAVSGLGGARVAEGSLAAARSSQRNAGADQQHSKIAHGPVLKLLDTIILCCYEHMVLMVAGLVALNDSER